MQSSFNNILRHQSSIKRSKLCIGLDIDSDRMPKSMDKTLNGVKEYIFDIIDSTSELCVAYKLNMAFYERYGSKGYKLMEDVVSHIDKNNIVIADGKRGDIGNTTKKYAISIFDTIGFDAITVSPYMGSDSVTPFIDNPSKGAFVLCLTSNPSAKDFQFINQNNISVYEYVAKFAKKLNTNDNIGLVVGATKPEFMSKIRKSSNLPWLIPGIGAQGGELEKSVKISNRNDGLGIINVSRAIIFAGDCRINDVVNATNIFNDKINLGKL